MAENTPPGSPSAAVEATTSAPPADPTLALRQEDDLEALESAVDAYIRGYTTTQSKEGREKLGEAFQLLHALWTELEQQVGAFDGIHFPTLQLCRAAAKLFSKQDDDLSSQLLELGAQCVLGPLFRMCGRPADAGSADQHSEVRHYATNLIYRLAPSKLGVEWLTGNVTQVDAITALFGDEGEEGKAREHAAVTLLSLSRIANMQDQLTQPVAMEAYLRTLAKGGQGDGYSDELRRYAGTIFADLSSVPSLQRHVALDPGGTFPLIVGMLQDSAGMADRSIKRTAASILSELSKNEELQPSMIQYGAVPLLIAACGHDVLEPTDTKLQLLALYTLANLAGIEDSHSQFLGDTDPGPPGTGNSRPDTAVSFDVMQSPPATASTPPILRVILPLMQEDVRPQLQRQRYAVAILTRLARSPNNQELIGSHTYILRRILMLMARMEAEPAAARQAVSLLSVLSVNPRNQMRISKLRLPIDMSSDEPEGADGAGSRGAIRMLMQMLQSADSSLARCAACAITNVAANVGAHQEIFACKDMVRALFALIVQRKDMTLQKYACDALSNLALGSHRRPPTRDDDAPPAALDTAAAEQSDSAGKAGGYKVEFPSRIECSAICQLIMLADEEDDAETTAPTATVNSDLPEHAVNALCSLGRCRANQAMMKTEPALLRRLGSFVAMMLNKIARAASSASQDLPATKVDEKPLTFALRLIGALCPSETPDDREFEPELARYLMQAVQIGSMRTATVALNALRKMCKSHAVHNLCAESGQLLASISGHLDSGIRHTIKEKMNRPIRRAAAELLFKLSSLPQCIELIASTCMQDYLATDRPFGYVIGGCLKICASTPQDAAPDLLAAACGAMFNAASRREASLRIVDDPAFASFAIPLIGVSLDRTEDSFLKRQRLQDYVVGLLSNLTSDPKFTPRLVQQVATVSPNGVRDLTSALHDQLGNAAACLTETAQERWEFTQTKETIRSGCYAAAVLSKLTTHPDVRAATIIKKAESDENAAQLATQDTESRTADAQATDGDSVDEVIDEDDKKGTHARHRQLDSEWWSDTVSYECPIAEKMFRILGDDDGLSGDDDDAISDEQKSLCHYAAITLWHLTASAEDGQRARRTIGANTTGWLSMAKYLSRPLTEAVRKRPDSRVYVISTIWNLIRVAEFQPKIRFTEHLMEALIGLCNGIANDDPTHCYSHGQGSVPHLRTRLAGLLSEIAKDGSNADILAAHNELHSTLVSWLDVEKFEQEKAQILAAKAETKVHKNWKKVRATIPSAEESGTLDFLGAVKAKTHEAIEFERKLSFANRTVIVLHIAKQWLDEQKLSSRLAAEYGGVTGAVVRAKQPGGEEWNPEGEKHQSWAMVCFDYATTVERIFSHPHNPLLSMDETTLKADPDEPYSFDDPDVNFKIIPVDPDKAMNSEGQFGQKFDELRNRIQDVSKLTKHSHFVLQVLIDNENVKPRLSEKSVRAERDTTAEQRAKVLAHDAK